MMATPEKPEEVTASVKLPKPIHAKLTAVAKSEGVPLSTLLVRAAKEYAATYERTSQTVMTYTRKKKP